MNRRRAPILAVGLGYLGMSLLPAFRDAVVADMSVEDANPAPSMAEDPALLRGRALFDQAFHRVDGVGSPEMNADSCRACHQDPVLGGAGPLEVNVSRFGFDDGGVGPFTDLPGGQAVSKLYPPHVPGREEHPGGVGNCFEQRQTPSILGDGLIETIPGFVILANEDPTDSNGDGIFGVAHRVTVDGNTEIGRFGWKAQVPTLRDFVNDAMFGELGMTTPDDGRGFGMRTDGDNALDPEVSPTQVDDIALFLSSLPAPVRGGSQDPQVSFGEGIFQVIGCSTCHIPELLGSTGRVPLFSNLLLHNVMPEGYRGMAEPGAGVGFFRTPPLWGIVDTAPYMHDGRAEDLNDAILHHHGEAAQVRMTYQALTPSQKQALILFLEDL